MGASGDGWRSFVAQAPDEVSSIVVTLTFPPESAPSRDVTEP